MVLVALQYSRFSQLPVSVGFAKRTLTNNLQMLALGFVTVLAFPTNLTWWALLLAVFISFAFSLPIGIIQAVTNNQIGLNVLTEFVYGYIQPGRPLALMM